MNMDEKPSPIGSTIIVALVAGLASLAGTVGGSYLSLRGEQEKASLQMALHADNGDPKQTSKNLIFWYKTGLLKLPITEKDLREAACNCNGYCSNGVTPTSDRAC
jgi:hypothetical protein